MTCHEFPVGELAVLHTASSPVSGGQVPCLSGDHYGIKALKKSLVGMKSSEKPLELTLGMPLQRERFQIQSWE